jgi:hypothetical protein
MSAALLTQEKSSDGFDDFFDNAPQLFAQLHEVYRQHGFEAGYARAVRDQLSSMVLFTEDFLRHEPDIQSNSRQLVYRFVAHLQAQLSRLSPEKKANFLRSA